MPRWLLPVAVAAMAACGGGGGSGGQGDDGGSGDGALGDAGVDAGGDAAREGGSDAGPDGPTPPVVGGADPTFGDGGLATVNLSFGLAGLFAVARQPDGSAVGVGGTQESIVVARVKPDGTFDPSFGNGGIVSIPFGAPVNGVTFGYGVAIQKDGKIVVATRVIAAYGTIYPLEVVLRLMPDGSFDGSFGAKGWVTGDQKLPSEAFSVGLQSSGDIVVGTASAVERRLPDGTLDTKFGTAGVTSAGLEVLSLAVRPDDEIVAAGPAPGGPRVALFTKDGAVDTSFGAPNGYAVVPSKSPDDTLYSVALQNDGKVLVGGVLTLGAVTNGTFALGRYDTDGTADPTFGTAGFVTDGSTQQGSYARGVGQAPDGKVVGTGAAGMNGGAQSMRFTAGGQPDTTFGGSGFGGVTGLLDWGNVAFEPSGAFTSVGAGVNSGGYEIAFGRTTTTGGGDPMFGSNGLAAKSLGGSFDRALALALQPDGKILLAGYNAGLARINTDGTLDASFGKAGVVFGAAQGLLEYSAVAVQQSGKILVTGFSFYNANPPTFEVARFDTSGNLDASFGNMGIGGGAIVAGQEAATGTMAIDSKGNILLAGGTLVTSMDVEYGLMRLGPDGALDPTFGTNGVAHTSYGPGMFTVGAVNHIAMQPDGKIVILAQSSYDGSGPVVRFDASGAVDTTFGTNGMIPIAKSGYALAVQGDGKIVVVSGDHTGVLQIARYTPAGALDAAFGNAGVASAMLGGSDYAFTNLDVPMGLLIQSDGKIMVGLASSADDLVEQAVLLRFGSDGTPDASFGSGGQKTLAIGRGSSTVHALALQPDGKLLVAGRVWTESGGSDMSVLRLLPQ